MVFAPLNPLSPPSAGLAAFLWPSTVALSHRQPWLEAITLLAALGATFLILGFAVPVAHQRDLATKTGRATGAVVDHVLYSTGRHLELPVVDFIRSAFGRWVEPSDRFGVI